MSHSILTMAHFCCILLSFTMILLHSPAVAQNSGKVTVGQSLTATIVGSSPWLSLAGDFAFGFHQYNNSSQLFLLAIWYAKIADATIVWYANGGNPIPQGSTVRLTGQGLILADPKGTHLWNASGAATISYCFMNDTGNFVLKDSSDNSVWESFKNPTDTLLPSQIMERGQVLNSRLLENNFTKGRFQFYFQGDGNLVINTRELETGFRYTPYYAANTADGENQTTAGQQLVYDESGKMYILRNDDLKLDLLLQTPLSTTDYYQRATMEFYGMLIWYYHPRSSSSAGWRMLDELPRNNICDLDTRDHLDSGICGYNNICSRNGDGTPSCKCAQNYSLINPSDSYGDCKPDFVQQPCDGDLVKGEYKLVALYNTNWPVGDYARLTASTEEECKSSCLNDCFCAAVVYDDNDNTSCWKKRPPLAYGIFDTTTLATTTTWLKVGDGDPYITAPTHTKPNKKANTVISVLLGGSAFANFLLLSAFSCLLFLFYQKKGFRRIDEEGYRRIQREYNNVTCFRYEDLEEATNEFEEEIGRGSFGVVYKGRIRTRPGDSHIIVAVKRLDRISNSSDKEFETEVKVIGQTHHKNLVRLIGFCKQGEVRLLVYEYMSNGTLADYLFGDLKPSWSERIQVIHGVARGLLYLHEECSTQIIHCDIKPQNILIDDCHNARISDFGLAKLLVMNQSGTNTAIRGTKGYIAPEWFRNKPVTVKVDVYSFGVLLLEIICCRKSVTVDIVADDAAILTDWASDCYQSRSLDSLVDDDIEALGDRPRLERFVMVALWCIQEEPSLRPTMRMVTQMLEGLVQVPEPPSPSSFSVITQC